MSDLSAALFLAAGLFIGLEWVLHWSPWNESQFGWRDDVAMVMLRLTFCVLVAAGVKL